MKKWKCEAPSTWSLLCFGIQRLFWSIHTRLHSNHAPNILSTSSVCFFQNLFCYFGGGEREAESKDIIVPFGYEGKHFQGFCPHWCLFPSISPLWLPFLAPSHWRALQKQNCYNDIPKSCPWNSKGKCIENSSVGSSVVNANSCAAVTNVKWRIFARWLQPWKHLVCSSSPIPRHPP